MADSPRQPVLLQGIRVLDLSRVLAGPWAGQLLADYGADVIKVERPGVGDDTRTWGPYWFGPEEERRSSYYLAANRGKRSIAVDMGKPEGVSLLKQLARQADVVIENYKTGDLAKFGLDYASLQGENPRLIYCSITGFGLSGPYRNRPGYDLAIQAMGGLMSVTGEADGVPLRVGVALIDVMTGLYSATAILAALQGRAATGKGTHIDCALLDVAVTTLANQATSYLVSGKAPGRMGNAHPSIVPYQAFASADGHVVLAVGNDGQYRKFCEVAGRMDLATDARYLTNPQRVTNRASLVPEIERVIRTRTSMEWSDALEREGVPCAPIQDIAQVFADAQVIARGQKLDLVDASGPPVPSVASPAVFDGVRAVSARPPPRLDEQGDEIRAEVTSAPLA